MYVVIWEFRVRQGRTEAFERLYGADGSWIRLFRTSPDYKGTELVRGAKDDTLYVTIDHWRSRDAYLAFQQAHRADYDALDREGQQLTDNERLIGEYDAVGAAASAST